MGIIEIVLLGIGLAMDAFAVSICKGLAMKKMSLRKAIIIGLYFAIFQAGMPLIGFCLGKGFYSIVDKYDHWIAFILLGYIGGKMIKDVFSKGEECNNNDSVDIKTMLVLAIATSIDALAVGITFAFLEVNLWFAISMIGLITFVMSIIGVKIGNIFGDKYEKKARIAGGIILVSLGIKILLEHLGIISF